MRSQVDMIRNLMRRLCGSKLTLKDKAETIFREQGVTVAAVLTAISTTIIATIKHVVSAIPHQHLPKLVLVVIIDVIISWIFRVAANIVGRLGQNL